MMGGIEWLFSLALLCLLCGVGLLGLAAFIFALVKLGVIAGYWGKPAPTDTGDQTLAQSREAGAIATPTTPASPSSTLSGGEADRGQHI